MMQPNSIPANNPSSSMSVSRIQLRGAAKKYGGTIAVYPLDLSIKAGEFIVILGPSGCGKTTTLRMIAGLETPSQGEIFVDGKEVTSMRPGARDMAFVFQMYSLYPHLTVLENVAFPLRAQGLSKSEAERLAIDMVRVLGMETKSHFRPQALSGGDQQRVGLARALVRSFAGKPKAFLMDEPLGSLDGSMREEIRETLRTVHNQSGATTVFVTHDQAEAMSLADRIAVMKDGRLVQFDHPRTIYDYPANLFVADFVGSPGMNIFRAQRIQDTIHILGLGISTRITDVTPLESLDTTEFNSGSNTTSGADCFFGIRPQNIILTETGAPCMVEHTEIMGSYNLLSLKYAKGFLKAWLPSGIQFREGETVHISFLLTGCRYFNAESGQALSWRALEVQCQPMR